MKPFEFTVKLPMTDAPDSATLLLATLTGPIFVRFGGDVVPALIGDDIIIDCTVEGASLAGAVGEVARFLESIADTLDEFADAAERRAWPSGAAIARPSQPFPFMVEAAGADLLAV